MSLKSKIMATALGLTTLFGPTVNIDSKSVVSEQKIEYKLEAKIEQNNAQARDYNLEGRAAVLGFDLLINGLKSGLGAYANGEDFWPAFGKGLGAGAIVYAGKEIASHNRYPFLGVSGKLVHDLGVSMSDNVMLNKPIMSRYVTDFGPIEIHFEKGKENKIYFQPFSACAILGNLVKGNDFDLKQTLYNFTPVFSYKVPLDIQQQGFIGGYTTSNVIAYCRNCKENDFFKVALSHEMNHVLFFSEFRFLDYLTPNKKIVFENMLFLHPFAEQLGEMRYGPMLAQGLLVLPKLFSKEAYWYLPHELEAFTMEMPRTNNAHPLY